jgi:pyrimidine deaminase RibD-like protein
MILGELSSDKIYNTPKLDHLLAKLCALVVQGKKSRPDHYGMVAACVVDTDNQVVYGINEPDETGHRIHAERVAIDRYHDLHGEIPSGSIIITTLSPCSQDMAERHGDSCTDLINQSGVKKVYCGYMDPTQDTDPAGFTLQATENAKITELCRMFADTFLKEEWSAKYKRSINCAHPKGFSQRAHCAGRKKHR